MDQLQAAYLLLTRPYSNTSLLAELFSIQQGRLAVIAKGARRQAGKGGGHLQPFIPLEAAWRGRGEVKTLIRAEATGLAHLQHGPQLYCGFYLNELLMRLIGREDPHPQLFHHYEATLQRLGQQDDPEPLLRHFEVALLEELGYGVPLLETLEGQPVRAELRYHYRIESGVSEVTGASPASLSGETLLALAGEIPFQPETTREARALMRGVLGHYLGPQPLKSRELFRALYSGRVRPSEGK